MSFAAAAGAFSVGSLAGTVANTPGGLGATEYAGLIHAGFTMVKVPESIRFVLEGELPEQEIRIRRWHELNEDERKYLTEYFDDMPTMATNIFLKGYQWPFDAQRITGRQSSLIDMAVHQERAVRCRRVFMDFLVASNHRFRNLPERLWEESGVAIEYEHGTGLLYLLYDESQRRHAQAILQWLGPDQDLAQEWTPEQVRERATTAHQPRSVSAIGQRRQSAALWLYG